MTRIRALWSMSWITLTAKAVPGALSEIAGSVSEPVYRVAT